MKKFHPELELQFRLLEDSIIKKKLNYFKKKKKLDSLYEEQIKEQIKLEEYRIKKDKIIFNLMMCCALLIFIIAMLILIDIVLENKIYNYFFRNNYLFDMFPNSKVPELWT